MKNMKGKTRQADLPYQQYTTEFQGHEYIVKARTDQEARKTFSHRFKEEFPSCAYPLTYIQENVRIRRHKDRRIRFSMGGVPSILEEDKNKEQLHKEEATVTKVLSLLDNKRTAAQLEELLKTV